MVKQGGLGRGLASLIPQKNKIAFGTKKNKIIKRTTKKVVTGGNKIKKNSIFKSSPVGEANYFGNKVTNINLKNKGSVKSLIKDNIIKKSKDKKGGENKNSLKGVVLKSLMEVGVDEIVPNPYQPRTNFDAIKLQELADSIVEHGIIQPLVVSHRKEGGYELIAGERRLEASKLAGLVKVPVVTRQVSEQNKAEWALIENIQRHNLNPIEEALAYEKMQAEFNLTQEGIAKKVGKSRSAVANILRLLMLPKEIKEALASGKITESHGRTILALKDEKKQMDLFRSILRDGLNVRQVEKITQKGKVSRNYRQQKEVDPDILNLENRIADNLKTKVKIRGIRGNGKIIIDYYSEEELGEIGKKLVND